LTVYKGGNLEALSVIPLGSGLITKDIMSLHIIEAEAERIKCAYGNALPEKDLESRIQISSADGVGLRDISLADLNNIVEARIREILENVYARLEETGMKEELGAGVVITGGGSALKNLTEAIRERLKVDVRCSAARKGIINSGDINPGNPEYAVAIGLLAQGTENCAIPAPEEPLPQAGLFNDFDEVSSRPVTKEPPRSKPQKQKTPKPQKQGLGLFDRLKKGMDNMANGLFDNEE